jgi:ParB-like chromosome segregation protein Spo0J
MNTVTQHSDTPSETVHLPLSALWRSPLNVRKQTQSDTTELEASIEAHGLIQNLVVTEQHPTKGKDKAQKTHGVVAGARRLAALQQLVKRKL